MARPPSATPPSATSPTAGVQGSPLSRFVRRLTATEQQRDAEQLQQDASQAGCALAAECRRGQPVRLTGRLRTVGYAPRGKLPALEAELYDGSGTVTLVWLGRRRIAGIEPGRTLTARGRLALREGRKVIYNPYYELRLTT